MTTFEKKRKIFRYTAAALVFVVGVSCLIAIYFVESSTTKKWLIFSMFATVCLLTIVDNVTILINLANKKSWKRFCVIVVLCVATVVVMGFLFNQYFLIVSSIEEQERLFALLDTLTDSQQRDEVGEQLFQLSRQSSGMNLIASLLALSLSMLSMLISFFNGKISNEDLERATDILKSDSQNTCVLVKDIDVFASKKTGIQPMLDFIDSGKDLKGFAVADKIVGKAAALLFAYAKIKFVYAEVLSEKAIPIFNKFRIEFCFDKKTPQIENRNGDGVCPMEQAVENISVPDEALVAIKEKLKELRTPF